MAENTDSSKILRIVIYIVCGLLILYFLFAILPGTLFPNGLETEIAEEASYSDCIELSGIAIRNEVPLFAENSIGAISYAVADGARVAIKSNVATYITSSASADEYANLLVLNRKIDQLSASLAGTALSDTAALEQQVKASINQYLNVIDEKEYKREQTNNIQVMLNKKAIKLNGDAAYTAAKSTYEAEKAALLSSIGKEKQVSATIAGFFVSAYDGYEFLSADKYNTMTVEDYSSVMAMQPEPKSDNYVGKLHNNTIWYFSSEVSEEIAQNYKVGGSVKIIFNIASTVNDTLNATVFNISPVVDGKAVITFKFMDLTEKEFAFRKEKCKIIVKNYKGLKVGNEALRVVDGQTGVYVLVAQRIVFKPVNVLFTGESFSIVSTDSSVSSRTLTQNDDVVLGGKDLFDGKVVGVG